MKSHSEQTIDRVLNGMRDAEIPQGLEARIAGRIANTCDVAAASTRRPAFFAPQRFLTLFANPSRLAMVGAACALVLAAWLAVVFPHRQPHIVAKGPEGQPVTATVPRAKIVQATAPGNLGHTRPQLRAVAVSDTASTDPDSLALVETLAPSHPAPPMPLTAQERLMLRATRQGQPIEMAELQILQEPGLRAAAEAHQRVRVRAYIEGLLGPLAVAQALSPTSSSLEEPTSTSAASPASR